MSTIRTFSEDELTKISELAWQDHKNDFVDELNQRLAHGVKVAQTQLSNGQYSSFEEFKQKVEDIKL